MHRSTVDALKLVADRCQILQRPRTHVPPGCKATKVRHYRGRPARFGPRTLALGYNVRRSALTCPGCSIVGFADGIAIVMVANEKVQVEKMKMAPT